MDVRGTAVCGTFSSAALVRASDRICKKEDLTAESGIAGTQSRDSSSQNSSAEAKPTCASSSSELKALPVKPGTPEDPETLKEKSSNLVPVIWYHRRDHSLLLCMSPPSNDGSAA